MIAAALCGCSVVNSLDPCGEIAASEARINERGDGQEFLGHPKSAVATAGDRVFVVFEAQDDADALKSEVRLAILDTNTGLPITLCTGADLDVTVAGPHAYAASVARADLTIEGQPAVALVSWVEREAGASRLRMGFYDAAGCLVANSFSPYEGSVHSASLEWSASRQAVLATLEDGLDVRRAWLVDIGLVEWTVIAQADDRTITSAPIAGVLPDGGALVAWRDQALGARGAFLDDEGNSQSPIRGQDLGFPDSTDGTGISVTAGPDRFAVSIDGGDAESFVRLREFSAAGSAIAPARRLDADRGSSLVLTYLDADTLFAAWSTSVAQGTVGSLSRPGDGEPMFNALSCDERRFAIGSRTSLPLGYPAALPIDDEVWVFHAADLPSDPIDNGVALWRVPFAELWPARD